MHRWQLGSFGLAAGLSPSIESSAGAWDKSGFNTLQKYLATGIRGLMAPAVWQSRCRDQGPLL